MRRIPASLTLAGLALAALGAALPAPFVPAAAFADEHPKPADPVPPGTPVPPPGMDEPGMDEPGMDPAAPDPGMPGMADPANPPPTAATEGVPLAEALSELSRLKTYLGNRKSDNGDVLASMDATMKAYKSVRPDADPPADPAAATAAKAAFEAAREKFWGDVETQLLKAMGLVRPNLKTKSNERDDVNVKAATLLGQTRPDVVDNLIKVFETKREYDPPTAYYDETMKSIGLLNDHKKGLQWLIDNWFRHKNAGHEPEIVNAAYGSIQHFKDVKGATRLLIVKQTMTLFGSSESEAAQNKTKEQKAEKEFWEKVKLSLLRALQILTKEPKDDKGVLLGSMKAFDTWFRQHDKPHDPAWQDPKPAK